MICYELFGKMQQKKAIYNNQQKYYLILCVFFQSRQCVIILAGNNYLFPTAVAINFRVRTIATYVVGSGMIVNSGKQQNCANK